MSYEYSFAFQEALAPALATGGIRTLSTSALGLASYVFIALSLYTLAKDRGISKPWLAWIPVVNVWILGSLSDQYRYVARGEIKSKRKVLLVLNVLQTVLSAVVIGFAVAVLGNVIYSAMGQVSEQVLLRRIIGPALGMLGFCVPLLGLAIWQAVVYYMALYDIYTSCEPGNSTLYLVLSIIPGISAIARPLLLFLCRNKDEGMPPRQQPQPSAREAEPREPWQNEE